MATRLIVRQDTLANWTLANPILASGELGFEMDTGQMRVGDGSTPFLSLATVSFRSDFTNIVRRTQAQYDALTPPDPAVLYIIVG